MRRIRTLRFLLAGTNLLLAAAIVLFAALVLFPRADSDLGLPEVPWGPPPEEERSGPDHPLSAVRNPLQPSSEPPPAGLSVALLGTLPNRELAAAFFRSGKEEFVAFVGEPVGAWRLEEVGQDRAVLARGSDRRVVRLEENAPPRLSVRRPPAGDVVDRGR